MEKELEYLGRALDEPKRPFVAVLGGAKISGKIDLIAALLPKVDEILIGGAMACTFFRAMGLETGTSLVEEDRVDMAARLLEQGGRKLVLPSGAVIAQRLASDAETRTVGRESRFTYVPQPVERARSYLESVSAQWDDALTRLKAFVES